MFYELNFWHFRKNWLILEMKKLYVEHVIVPSPEDPSSRKRKPYKIKFLVDVRFTISLLCQNLLHYAHLIVIRMCMFSCFHDFLLVWHQKLESPIINGSLQTLFYNTI